MLKVTAGRSAPGPGAGARVQAAAAQPRQISKGRRRALVTVKCPGEGRDGPGAHRGQTRAGVVIPFSLC